MSRLVAVCVKQETASEVRISDWSSYVCSSYLGRDAGPRRYHRRKAGCEIPVHPQATPGRAAGGRGDVELVSQIPSPRTGSWVQCASGASARGYLDAEIGRAHV